ncbi:urease accessory protein UreD [Neogemmobacter tilapiae]|uniref:Urease accessory protein UreD n=1 Tax=Neogemmobacter tilapiae TaxID=875041 RepID=A0A918WMT9_9RHOB|nr:urease accessory protein UreD [Gemmobacter tilapiae]GHC61351.1 urease accessory protein UreD [Gemmobacter tilapiae]
MFDAAPIRMERSRGRAFVGFAGGRLADLRQEGSAKAMLPRVFDGVPEVVFLNTSGGLTSGDRLELALDAGAGARIVATTQTAERAYAAVSGSAEVSVRLQVGAGGHLDWLPQETILFDRADLARRTRVGLVGDASLVMAETLVLGRAAMGESLARLALSDRREVYRDGRAVLVEPFALSDAVLAPRDALLGGARALGFLAKVGAGAEALVEPLRRVLAECDVPGAVSGWDGKCVVRLLAADGWPLRRAMGRLIGMMTGRPLPRVWQG